jgi:hypothetical protein
VWENLHYKTDVLFDERQRRYRIYVDIYKKKERPKDNEGADSGWAGTTGQSLRWWGQRILVVGGVGGAFAVWATTRELFVAGLHDRSAEAFAIFYMQTLHHESLDYMG